MRHTLTAILFAALLVAGADVRHSQNVESRDITLVLCGVCRGYARPMSATALRLEAVEGITSARAAAAGGDCLRFEIRTTLDGLGLARALGGELLDDRHGIVRVAPVGSERGIRAEAREAIARIAHAICAHPRQDGPGNGTFLFNEDDDIAAKLRKLGLEPHSFDGPAYNHAEYNISEIWGGSNTSYRIWAGVMWQGLPVYGSYDWGWDGMQAPSENRAVPADEWFVGAQLVRAYNGDTLHWTDAEGARLSHGLGERARTDGKGKLAVHDGKEWMEKVLAALARYRANHPRAGIGQMPRGRGWSVLGQLGDAHDLHRWGDEYVYDMQCISLEWQEEAGQLVCQLRAFHAGHAMYLHASMNVDKAVATPDDVSSHVQWVVDAEAGPEVFARRREEARLRLKELRGALVKAAARHAPAELCGRLDDAALRERIGLAWQDGEYTAADVGIQRQLLGDGAVTIGAPVTGGERWVLFNLQSGQVIRSFQ